MAKKEFNYPAARKELQELLDWFESGSTDLDKALQNYKRAEELIVEIEAYLSDIEKKLEITINSTKS